MSTDTMSEPIAIDDTMRSSLIQLGTLDTLDQCREWWAMFRDHCIETFDTDNSAELMLRVSKVLASLWPDWNEGHHNTYQTHEPKRLCFGNWYRLVQYMEDVDAWTDEEIPTGDLVFTLPMLDGIQTDGFDRAMDYCRDANTDDQWYEYSLEYWRDDILDMLGFNGADIEFSGFWSQGDGASFTAESIDVAYLINRLLIPPFVGPLRPGHDSVWESVRPHVSEDDRRRLEWFASLDNDSLSGHVRRNSSSYRHARSCETIVELSATSQGPATLVEEMVDTCITEFVEAIRTNLCHEIYKALEAEYEYMTSDEAALELGNETGWLFDIDGRPTH